MSNTYADAVKENLDADLIDKTQHHTTTTTSQDKHSDNYDASIYNGASESKRIAEDLKNLTIERDSREQKRTRDTKAVSKKAKSKSVVIYTTVALDIALAGLLIGAVYKRPTINKAKLGFGTVGLSLFYGFQWFFYQKHD